MKDRHVQNLNSGSPILFPMTITVTLNEFRYVSVCLSLSLYIFLSLRVFGLLSSSLLLFSQRFGWYVLRLSSGVCRTRKPPRNFELRPLLNPRESPVLIPLANVVEILIQFKTSFTQPNNWPCTEVFGKYKYTHSSFYIHTPIYIYIYILTHTYICFRIIVFIFIIISTTLANGIRTGDSRRFNNIHIYIYITVI